jgi:hypothetical protein
MCVAKIKRNSLRKPNRIAISSSHFLWNQGHRHDTAKNVPDSRGLDPWVHLSFTPDMGARTTDGLPDQIRQ